MRLHLYEQFPTPYKRARILANLVGVEEVGYDVGKDYSDRDEIESIGEGEIVVDEFKHPEGSESGAVGL